MASEQRYTATCKWFSTRLRYGFVSLDDEFNGVKDIYVGQTSLTSQKRAALRRGQRVSLAVSLGKGGKPEGRNVTQEDGTEFEPLAPRPRKPRTNPAEGTAAIERKTNSDGTAAQSSNSRPPRRRTPNNNAATDGVGQKPEGQDQAEKKPNTRRRTARRPSKYSMQESEQTQEIKQNAIEEFESRFGSAPQVLSYASGRVNLIGEHVDYVDGFVFPFAIHLGTCVAAKTRDATEGGPAVRVLSLSIANNNYQEFELDANPHSVPWVNYVKGVVYHYNNEVRPVPRLDLCIASNVPLGGGLSSSASLEVAVATMLEKVARRTFRTAAAKALLCQRAEHTFAKTPCGIMDQLVAVTGKPGHAVLIDCVLNSAKLIPFGEDLEVVIANSNVKHNLADGEYAKRKADCANALELLKGANPAISSWRDVTSDMVEKAVTANPSSVPLKRARHVVTEIQRVHNAVTALGDQAFDVLGQLMNQSHTSLKTDYEVSCAELDELVDIARKCDGVFGARMTGGGFGGSIVVLVEKGKGQTVADKIKADYNKPANANTNNSNSKNNKKNNNNNANTNTKRQPADAFVTVPSVGNKLLSLKPQQQATEELPASL
eukprot:c25800_g1_i1.p1 GENE.c25800_g1_i1~~c25800_g1_i1.p1  ORF type:complete len:602 (+),score=182.24 c25800_g1_i1:95-1900(+)